MNEEDLHELEHSLVKFLASGNLVANDIEDHARIVFPTIEEYVSLRMTLMREDPEWMNMLWKGIIKYD